MASKRPASGTTVTGAAKVAARAPDSVRRLEVEFVATQPGVKIAARAMGDSQSPCILLLAGQGATMSHWKGMDDRLVQAGFRVVEMDLRDMGQSSKFPIPFEQDSTASRGGSAASGCGTDAGVVGSGSDSSGADSNSDCDAAVVPCDETDDALGEAGVKFYNAQLRSSKLGTGRDFIAPYAMTDLANDCIAVLNHFGVAQAHILGASLGGVVAQICAVKHPERVKSLIGIMTTSDMITWTHKAFTANTQFFLGVLTKPQATRGMTREAYLVNRLAVWRMLAFDKGHPELSKEQATHLASVLLQDYDRNGVDWMGFGMIRQTLAISKWSSRHMAAHKEALKKLSVPTLVLHGVHDILVPLGGAKELASLVPGARLVRYNGGHNMPVDQHDFLVSKITELCHRADAESAHSAEAPAAAP